MALEDATNPMQGVSGPGSFAKRTDLQYQPDQYGAGVQYDATKQAVPLATAPATPHATKTQVRQAANQAVNTANNQAAITELYSPTQRPDEPITHGVDIGPGGGSNVLQMPNPVQSQYQDAIQLIQSLAQNPNASPTLQYLAQRIQQGY